MGEGERESERERDNGKKVLDYCSFGIYVYFYIIYFVALKEQQKKKASLCSHGIFACLLKKQR